MIVLQQAPACALARVRRPTTETPLLTMPTPSKNLHLRALPASLALMGLLTLQAAVADTTPQVLPFNQNWSAVSGLATDNWASVPGVMGYRGDDLTTTTGTDPQTVLLPANAVVNGGFPVVDVNVGQTNPSTYSTGGVTLFAIADPTIALAGSGTADAPSLVVHISTLGQQNIQVAYKLRDLDASTDNAVQAVALQYRVGNTGNFTNVPGAYVADATTGPGLADLVTPVLATLPADANNQAEVQVRIITTNAGGNDEYVGVDDIGITGSPMGGGGVNQPITTACTPTLMVVQNRGGTLVLTASDTDSQVNSATITSAAVAGIGLGSLTAAVADGESASVPLNVAAGTAPGTYAVTVQFGNNELQTASCTVQVQVNAATLISDIQGSGDTSPLAGQTVTTSGVVTLVTNNGFFMQDPVGDGDLSTSDGIYVFTSTTPSAAQVAVGNLVQVTGTVTEYAVGTGAEAVARPVTELTGPVVSLVSTGHQINPTQVFLPETTDGELERFEGMLVTIQTPLTASQNFFQGRYGQVTLSADGRLEKPTNLHPAGSVEALAMADANARRRILLDDGSTLQNPNPTPYFAADNTLRAGDTVAAGLTGVIDYGLATNLTDGISDYKIHPTQAVAFARVNERPAAPPAVGGNVRVGSFNVLNYFTTLDATGSAGCYPSFTRSDCRGADSAAEFQRQRNKIIPAILGLNADVVGLMEIENNGNTAVQDLVNGLNAVAGAGTYATLPLPAGGTGTDAIRMAMVYKPGRVSLVGGAVSDTNSIHNRPPLAQTFAAANGEKFAVVVNHFKSKGSCPTGTGADADQGDGQGCWNALRTQQAQALGQFVRETLQTVTPNVVVVGDLNAYGKEDPILELANQGLVDQIARFDTHGYSYVFDGEAGYLDHALVSTSLQNKVSGAYHWRINADEPSVIDYNTEFKPVDYYTNTVYRSSDHDPVLVGLSLVKTVAGSAGRDTLVGTAGDDRITGGGGSDVLTGGAGADTFVYTSTRDALDRITDFVPGTDRLDLSALLTSVGYSGSNAVADGVVRLVDTPAGLSVQIDTDGNAGAGAARPLVTLTGVTAAQIQPTRDLGL